MKITETLALSAPLLGSVSAAAIYQTAEDVVADVMLAAKRATPQAPDGYTPKAVDCPSDRPTIRSASTGLSDQETAWLEKRRNNTIDPMRDFLNRVNISGFDVGSYLDSAASNVSALPNIALTFSGGGWRAMLNGAGALAAFDSRTPGSTDSGQIGGVLQAATYAVGLSGGNWLTSSIWGNNFTSVQDIIDSSDSGSLWDFSNSILEGPQTSSIQLLSTADYWTNLISDANDKSDAGFNTSITDYWGRGLSYYLINATDGGPGYTFSSIADDPDFSNGNAPMPISVADGRYPGEYIISGNTTNYEFNPFEMGTWDPTVYGFAPLKYVGSRFSGGQLLQNDSCINGFDNIGFVLGTSSSLFNQLLVQINGTTSPNIAVEAIQAIARGLSDHEDDIADWSPNPFYFWNNETNARYNNEELALVDGGEDLQNIGFSPIIQPERNVDVIFAIDSSADIPADTPSLGSANWPNGTSMVATYERHKNGNGIANGTLFPAVPDINTFVNQGLNTRPTFFGCNSSAEINAQTPLVIYIPNHPYVYNSNVSTFQLTYNNTERNAIINNGYDVATLGNGTVDDMWPTCVGCAILSRSLARTGTDVPDVCQQCMSNYCWDGTRNSTTPAPYNPSLVLSDQAIDVQSAAVGLSTPSLTAAAAALLSVILLCYM